MDIIHIKRLLATSAEAVASHLLPGGKRDGSEWKCGSVDGEAGKSLGVVLKGPKAGVWQDFATGEGGDLLDLWSAVRRVPLADAIRDAKDFLGVADPVLHRPKKRQYKRPPKPAGATRVQNGRVLDYLREERNIPADVIEKYKLAEAGGNIVFPFLLPDGELALAKTRAPADGQKPKPTAAECEPILFGWQAVPENAREVVITEGEIDALSWAAYGYPAMSVPFGGGGGNKQQWIENDFDRLARFEKIYLSMDMDGPGEEAAEEIARRLGKHRCYRVSIPHKDANECLIEGVAADVMRGAIEGAATDDPEGLKTPSSYADDVINMFWPGEGAHIGYTAPYEKLDGKLRFIPGDVTVWSGDTGHGKSQILSDCVPHWLSEGSRVCLSSLEMRPKQTLKRLCKQTINTDRPTEPAIRAALDWMDGGLWLYDHVGKASADSLLEIFDYARARYGCDQFIIDSLMRLGVAGDDYNSQEAVIFRVVDWAVANEVHVHIVCHAKKGDRDRGSPGVSDIKGAMEIGGNAANIMTIWRNRRVEDDLSKAIAADERGAIDPDLPPIEELREKPGVVLNVAKQRNGDFEGKIGLWFDQETYRYRSSFRGSPERRYLPSGWQDKFINNGV